MSVAAVARKDFQDAVRSRALRVLAFAFVVIFVSAAYFFTDIFSQQVQQQAQQQGTQIDLTTDAFVRMVSDVTALLVPLIGVVVAYASVIGEREAGTLKLLLSLPHSRLDVVVGKVLGRGAVVGLPVVFGFAVAMLVFPLGSVSLVAGNYLLFALLTAVLGLTFVAIAVGVSAAASTYRRAVVGSVGLYFLLLFLWRLLVTGLLYYFRQNGPVTRLLEWLNISWRLSESARMRGGLLLLHLNPIEAYRSLTIRLIVENAAQARVSLISGSQQQIYLEQFGGSVPYYLSDPVVTLYLLGWLIVPPALGYYIFKQADL